MTDNIIYELHTRDLTADSTWNGSEENRGKFLGLCETGTTYTENGKTVKTGFDHIKELGVNTVQLLPIFDQDNDETKNLYNWGYNPENYNSLEGQYSQIYTNKEEALTAFSSLIIENKITIHYQTYQTNDTPYYISILNDSNNLINQEINKENNTFLISLNSSVNLDNLKFYVYSQDEDSKYYIINYARDLDLNSYKTNVDYNYELFLAQGYDTTYKSLKEIPEQQNPELEQIINVYYKNTNLDNYTISISPSLNEAISKEFDSTDEYGYNQNFSINNLGLDKSYNLTISNVDNKLIYLNFTLKDLNTTNNEYNIYLFDNSVSLYKNSDDTLSKYSNLHRNTLTINYKAYNSYSYKIQISNNNVLDTFDLAESIFLKKKSLTSKAVIIDLEYNSSISLNSFIFIIPI